jgi:hypothetical protein
MLEQKMEQLENSMDEVSNGLNELKSLFEINAQPYYYASITDVLSELAFQLTRYNDNFETVNKIEKKEKKRK